VQLGYVRRKRQVSAAQPDPTRHRELHPPHFCVVPKFGSRRLMRFVQPIARIVRVVHGSSE